MDEGPSAGGLFECKSCKEPFTFKAGLFSDAVLLPCCFDIISLDCFKDSQASETPEKRKCPLCGKSTDGVSFVYVNEPKTNNSFIESADRQIQEIKAGQSQSEKDISAFRADALDKLSKYIDSEMDLYKRKTVDRIDELETLKRKKVARLSMGVDFHESDAHNIPATLHVLHDRLSIPFLDLPFSTAFVPFRFIKYKACELRDRNNTLPCVIRSVRLDVDIYNVYSICQQIFILTKQKTVHKITADGVEEAMEYGVSGIMEINNQLKTINLSTSNVSATTFHTLVPVGHSIQINQLKKPIKLSDQDKTPELFKDVGRLYGHPYYDYICTDMKRCRFIKDVIADKTYFCTRLGMVEQDTDGELRLMAMNRPIENLFPGHEVRLTMDSVSMCMYDANTPTVIRVKRVANPSGQYEYPLPRAFIKALEDETSDPIQHGLTCGGHSCQHLVFWYVQERTLHYFIYET